MVALDIIIQARERLGDEKKQRWSDNRLISILSQGQMDICIETGYIRREAILPFVVGGTRFKLPEDCVELKRIEYNGELLPLHSRSDQDVPRVNNSSEYIAYKSNLDRTKLEIQPAITVLSQDIIFYQGDEADTDINVVPPYGVATIADTPLLIIDPVYGVITDREPVPNLDGGIAFYGDVAGTPFDAITTELPNGNYGVLVSAEVIYSTEKYGFVSSVKGHIVSGRAGIVTSISAVDDTFHLYYVASPTKIKTLQAILVIPDLWEELLLRYVVGTALQDDNDANNIARGEAELQKYEKQRDKLAANSAKDFSSGASDKFTTSFRRI